MATNTITEKDKKNISELMNIAMLLPIHEQEHLKWIGEGILFATNKASDGKAG